MTKGVKIFLWSVLVLAVIFSVIGIVTFYQAQR